MTTARLQRASVRHHAMPKFDTWHIYITKHIFKLRTTLSQINRLGYESRLGIEIKCSSVRLEQYHAFLCAHHLFFVVEWPSPTTPMLSYLTHILSRVVRTMHTVNEALDILNRPCLWSNPSDREPCLSCRKTLQIFYFAVFCTE